MFILIGKVLLYSSYFFLCGGYNFCVFRGWVGSACKNLWLVSTCVQFYRQLCP